MICSIEKAYQILNLEDPILYQNKIINQIFLNIQDGQINCIEDFIWLKRTGKSTYSKIEAAIYILSGKKVIYIVNNMISNAEIKQEIQDVIGKLLPHFSKDELSNYLNNPSNNNLYITTQVNTIRFVGLALYGGETTYHIIKDIM